VLVPGERALAIPAIAQGRTAGEVWNLRGTGELSATSTRLAVKKSAIGGAFVRTTRQIIPLLGALILTLVVATGALAAPQTTPVSVCGTFREYVAATNQASGKLTIGDQSFAIAPRENLQNRPAVVDPAAKIGTAVCLTGDWVQSQTLGRMLEEFRVMPNAATAVGTEHLPSTATARTDVLGPALEQIAALAATATALILFGMRRLPHRIRSRQVN
jgi:hypothetical protein